MTATSVPPATIGNTNTANNKGKSQANQHVTFLVIGVRRAGRLPIATRRLSLAFGKGNLFRYHFCRMDYGPQGDRAKAAPLIPPPFGKTQGESVAIVHRLNP